MKKIYILIIAAAMALSVYGCSSSDKENSDSSSAVTTENTEEKYDYLEEFAPGVSCEKTENEVRLTVPQDYMNGLGINEMEGMNPENGYKECIENDDGTTTLVLTPELHGNISEAMRLSLKFSVTQMDLSDTYPNFTSVSSNDDFTRFDVTTTQDTLSEEEAMTMIDFLRISATYNAIAGNKPEGCRIVFTNEATGQIVQDFDTSKL